MTDTAPCMHCNAEGHFSVDCPTMAIVNEMAGSSIYLNVPIDFEGDVVSIEDNIHEDKDITITTGGVYCKPCKIWIGDGVQCEHVGLFTTALKKDE